MNRFESGRVRARVCRSHGDQARVLFGDEEYEAVVRGALLADGQMPVTGDWVFAREIGPEQALIEEIEPRRTRISRRAAGRAAYEQVLAANVDIAFIVAGLDSDFNVRRMERYLAIAYEGGVQPVVVLNKADLVRGELPEVPCSEVIAVSARTGQGLYQMKARLTRDITAVLLGSSGAGKSSILNRLLGTDRQRVNAVREHDSRGRHTTTSRELVHLPGGAWIIDTPGLREIQIAVGPEALDAVFDEIADLGANCRFADCRHESEPGCAVRAGVDPERLESFHKLQRESLRVQGELNERSRWTSAAKAMKQLYRERDKW